MTKPLKTTVTFALVAALASAGFSQTAANSSKPSGNIQAPGGMEGRRDFRGPHCNPSFGKSVENILVGKVKKVNLSTEEITVTNSDGKDITVKVSPFTDINVELTDDNFKRSQPKPPAPLQGEAPSAEPAQKASGEALPPPAHKEYGLSDIRGGSWVLISVFKSDTKALNAASVFAKVRESTVNNDAANAK